MNLTKLFETQRKLDARIVEEKGLEGRDLLPEKILALQVELGELANEWRGFKFWKENPEPRTKMFRVKDILGKEEDWSFDPRMVQENFFPEVKEVNPMLEEYVDCLHFILSIGLEKGFDGMDFPYLYEANYGVYTETKTLNQFTNLFRSVNEFGIEEDLEFYEEMFLYFIGLSKHFGFTLDEVERAYMEKNKINHSRQENGY